VKKYTTVQEYVASFPKQTQQHLKQLQELIATLAPHATQVISYNMPAFKLDKMLVYYAAYKNHIGFYPGAKAIEKFNNQFKKYKWAKGSIQFTLNEPLPLLLIKKMVNFKLKIDFL
jgi:uncharacterized protein YdhG (YjbR/CyaY superfamily)